MLSNVYLEFYPTEDRCLKIIMKIIHSQNNAWQVPDERVSNYQSAAKLQDCQKVFLWIDVSYNSDSR